ncbi:hypothetical protein [Mycobacteroides abscessus]|uniref:hypothetical protein n=1 Tax=Mycobacteroides abscessus TaxID=36809 RepID=UPI000C26ADA5|nr:hypothetical protein [Mycobacteroides abscessus]
MSLSVGELKKVSVQSIRDISAGLRAKAASMRATQAGVTDLPHKGTWTGVAADNADHEIGTFAKGVGRDADAYEDAARKVDRAGDEFEGLKQLLAKLENEAAGKFSINEATGEVTPLTKDFNKADRDYIANTIKQLCAAGGQANDDLAAGIHATDASGATSPAGAGGGPLALTPNSSVKPDGVVGGMQNIAGPKDADPGATKAAAATAGSTDTINYKELYPKTTVDGHQPGSLGAMPGVGNIDKTKPAKLAPTLADRDVPAFKEITRQNLINAKVPADQIEQRVNDAVKAAQAPRFLPDADPMRTPGEVPLHNSPGDQFNDIVGRANDEATKTIDGQIEQAKILTGQAGPGAPGVAEAWKDVGLGAAKQVHELMSDPLAAPKMGIEQAKDFYNHPGEFIGKNIIHGTEALAGGAVGGEAAAGARGLLGDLTGTETRALTHGIDDATPGHHSAPGVDHHAPASSDHGTSGDHHGGSGGDHSMPGDVPSHFAPLPDTGPYQLPERAQLATPSDGAFFWSGRNVDGTGIGPISAGGNGAADLIADGSRATTLEGLLDSQGIRPPKWSPTDSYAQKWWDGTSQMYAESASGEVRAVIGSNLRPGNVWQTVELPRLMDNPYVNRIVVIDPDTGIETTVFER